MRLLFISANRLRRVMPPMPLGLASVIGQIDESRHEIVVLDLMFSEDPDAELAAVLAAFKPELIAISVRNLDNQCYLKTEYLLPEVKETIELCRSLCAAVVVVGGPAVTVTPAAVLEYLGADLGIAGEGEVVFRDLVERLERGADTSDLPGLAWREDGRIRVNPPAHVEDLDSLRPPRRDLFDSRRYADEGGIANIVVKQGCVFRCLYCDSPHTLGPRWRMKSAERVADELEAIQKDTGEVPVFFTDSLFNHPVDHAAEVCEAIVRRKLEITWIAGVHPAFLDRKLLELMHAAGCRMISLGCDTASEKMLKIMQKDFTKEHLGAALDVLEAMDFPYILSLLVGGPGEDRQTIEETTAFLADRKPLMLNFCVGIRLMPHTPLAAIAVEEGVLSADDPLMEPRFYVSPEVKDWVQDYLMDFSRDRPGWTVAYE